MSKKELIGQNLDELRQFAQAMGDQPYRGTQLFDWIYGRGVDSFESMSNLSVALRDRLSAAASLRLPEVIQRQASRQDDTEKFLLRLQDGMQIECVLMHEDDRHTLCVSSQVGCPIDCKFCATGKMGLTRNLTAGEIVGQFLVVRKHAETPVSNIVVMGMGEPLNNYDAVIRACDLISDPRGGKLSKRHIVISTSGLIPKIDRYREEGHKYRLAISLNATTDEVRTRLMPLNKNYPIRELLRSARDYALSVREPVTIEYVLLAGVNDSREDALRLKKLLRGLPCKINLIPYNAIDEEFRRPERESILAFFDLLKDFPAPVTLRWSKGDDIDAACGQLWTKANPSLPGRVTV